jgi:signal transduction histidine kinase
MPSWIATVQRMRGHSHPLERGPRTRQMESAQLIEFFDGIVTAVETGSTDQLDTAIQALVTGRLGQDYTLTDFLSVANELKSAIWGATRNSLSDALALDALSALEPAFSHSVTRLAWIASRAAEMQLEEELERAEHRLARLDRTKSDFITIAAHELKTPLTVIQGYAAILAGDEALLEQRPIRGLLNGLTSGIHRLQGLVQDMIDVSLIDSNVLALSLQPGSLDEIAQLALDDLEREAIDRDVKIEKRRFPRETQKMYLDAKRMYQVFTNLVGNAIKYTPDGGAIRLAAQILVADKQGLKFVRVSVADTGIGIAQEDLARIFEKFYRVGEIEFHSTSKTRFKGGGPGLGLSIAQGIVEAHGGRIWAESPGYDEQRCPGTTFHVVLPVNAELPESLSQRLLGLDSEFYETLLRI